MSIALGGALALFLAGALWFFDRAGAVHTSDARVRARMVTISSDVAGRILEIPVSAGDQIAAGETLARLDDREASLAVAALSLELEAVEAEIVRETLRAGLARKKGKNRIGSREASLVAARADFAAAEALLETTEAEHSRTSALRSQGLATQSALDQADARLQAGRQSAARASAAIAESKAYIGEAAADAGEARVIESNIEVLSLRVHALRKQLALRKVELEYHTITSPVTGVIDEVFADKGEHISPGARIALAHDAAEVWIEANIKETEIARIKEGARVAISFDAVPGRSCEGEVEQIRSAAAAEFALIPNANPTGVFTKITQRIPVRIGLGDNCPAVRPGAMATLKIRANDRGR